MELPLSLTFPFLICHHGGVVLGTMASQTNDYNTDMAGKATAGAVMCESVTLTTTLSKQRCRHVTTNRVVEKECDGRC